MSIFYEKGSSDADKLDANYFRPMWPDPHHIMLGSGTKKKFFLKLILYELVKKYCSTM